jgi:integrase
MLMKAIEAYLEVRRLSGCKLRDAERLLRRYADFAAARGDTHVRVRTAVDWSLEAGPVGQRRIRLRQVVLFARYARAEDPHHQVPHLGLLARVPHSFQPYIYTPEEARRLVVEAGRLGPPGSLRPHTYRTLFALLFATGLRISEAMSLRFDDVRNEGLLIRQTKFRKTRLVPLHETARAGLARYIALRHALGGTTDYVFISSTGGPLEHSFVHRTFRALLKAAKIGGAPGQPQPRIHDMRHTFAVRALEASPDGRDRIAQHMLALTTYLGHTSVVDTYWYLRATPPLMRDIADACECLLAEEGKP